MLYVYIYIDDRYLYTVFRVLGVIGGTYSRDSRRSTRNAAVRHDELLYYAVKRLGGYG